jgi:hypothetical protein
VPFLVLIQEHCRRRYMADEVLTGSAGGRLLGDAMLTGRPEFPSPPAKLKVKKPSFNKAVGIVLDLAAESIHEQDKSRLNDELRAVSLRQEKALNMVQKFLLREVDKRLKKAKRKKHK